MGSTASTALKNEARDIKQEVAAGIAEVRHVLKSELDDARAAIRAATMGKVETAARNVGDTVRETRVGVLTTMRENPVPTALIGVGIAWLLMNGTSAGRRTSRQIGTYATGVAQQAGHLASDVIHRARDLGADVTTGVREMAEAAGSTATSVARDASRRVENLAHGASDAARGALKSAQGAGNLVHGAADTVGSLAHDAGNRVGNVVHQAADSAGAMALYTRDTAYTVEARVARAARENPVAAAFALFAVGTAVGLLFPSTRRENALMGGARDALAGKAEKMLHGAVQKAQATVAQAVGADA